MHTDNIEFYKFLSKLAKNVAELFGRNCETTICRPDLPDHHIVEIYNGHVTGRVIGDRMSILGTRQIENKDYCTDWPSYTTKTSDGKIIKSFSLYTKIQEKPYVFGVNFDCTDLVSVLPAMSFIENLVNFNTQVEDDFGDKHISSTADEMNKAIKRINKSPVIMNTHERKMITKELYENGFFRINGSVKLLADKLNVSHHTVYKYLRELKEEDI